MSYFLCSVFQTFGYSDWHVLAISLKIYIYYFINAGWRNKKKQELAHVILVSVISHLIIETFCFYGFLMHELIG